MIDDVKVHKFYSYLKSLDFLMQRYDKISSEGHTPEINAR